MGEQIRVVFFHIGSDTFGGGSKMLLRLLRSLHQDKFDPVLLSNTADELCRRARKHGVEVKIVPFRGALDTYNRALLSDSHLLPRAGVRILQFNWDTYSFLRKADIIWCKNLRAVLTFLPYLTLTQTPSIWNIGLGLKSEGKVRYLNSIALRTADHVFIESEKQARRIFSEAQYEHCCEQFTIFHKGIDTKRFDPSRLKDQGKNGEFRVGTAVSITPRKGLEYLIDAISRLLEEREDISLFIAGEPPSEGKQYKTDLQQQIHEQGIEDNVTFLGWVDDMPKYLNSLDVFVLPSLNEGISGAVREALAMELPTVTTNVGGMPSLVNDGENALLVEPGNAIAISRSLLWLLDNPEECAKLGKRGRETIEQEFSLESYIREYKSFIINIS